MFETMKKHHKKILKLLYKAHWVEQSLVFKIIDMIPLGIYNINNQFFCDAELIRMVSVY